ncbi:MAG: DUF6186 family protein [Acidimicrobiales bacterium]
MGWAGRRAGEILSLLRRRAIGRGLIVVFWAWLGWHLFAR